MTVRIMVRDEMAHPNKGWTAPFRRVRQFDLNTLELAMPTDYQFHEGELEAQRITGEAEAGKRNGQAIGDSIHAGVRMFIERQPFAVAATIDATGRIWTSVLLGELGFLSVTDEKKLDIDLSRVSLGSGDPIQDNINANGRIGLLIIDLKARLRVRVNGRAKADGNTVQIAVEESFPNCPKYIQRRSIESGERLARDEIKEGSSGVELNQRITNIITKADTFFIGSIHAERGVDASHRGGMPGFVEIIDNKTIKIPDYAGNSMFNTIGNLLTDPRAGLAFIDFDDSQVLQLTGTTQVTFSSEKEGVQSGGTGRHWEFTVSRWHLRPLPIRITDHLLEYSPYNPPIAP